MPVQKTVNRELPAAYHGDFCDANPRVTLDAPEGGWRAGANGVQAGSFVWADENNRVLNNSGTGTPDAFVGREGLSIIQSIPQAASVRMVPGQPVTAYAQAGFWVQLPAGVTATRGAPVYTDTTTGGIVASGSTNAAQTRFFYATSGTPGAMVKMTSYMAAPVAPAASTTPATGS